MKARDAIGKRIVAIRQTRERWQHGNSFVWNVTALILDDGTRITVNAVPSVDEIYVEMTARRPPSTPRGTPR